MITTHYPWHEYLLLLVEREITWLRRYILSYSERKFAIFATGHYGQAFFYWLKDELGKEVDVFIDNNPSLCGEIVCGKRVLYKPWENDPEFCKDYFVLISSSDTNYHQISEQLSEVGVPVLSSDAFCVANIWDRCKAVVQNLDNDISKVSYLALIWYWSTYDSQFIQTIGDVYFAAKEFTSPFIDIVVDAGAHVGDTTEEYLKKSLGTCKVYAFEPDEVVLRALNARANRLNTEYPPPPGDCTHDLVTIVTAGVSDNSGYVSFTQPGKGHSSYICSFNKSGGNVKVFSLDDYFSDKDFPTIIKADVEGAELDMLKGSAGIIKSRRPKLAISIYHSPIDCVKIPEYILRLNNGYRMEVRNHRASYHDTILYCW